MKEGEVYVLAEGYDEIEKIKKVTLHLPKGLSHFSPEHIYTDFICTKFNIDWLICFYTYYTDNLLLLIKGRINEKTKIIDARISKYEDEFKIFVEGLKKGYNLLRNTIKGEIDKIEKIINVIKNLIEEDDILEV